MEVILRFNKAIQNPKISIFKHLEEVFDLATAANSKSHFNTSRIEVVSLLTYLAEIIGGGTAKAAQAMKAVAIFSELVTLPMLREFMIQELNLSLHLINFFSKGFVTDAQKVKFLHLLSVATSRNVKIDHGAICLNSLFSWLLELRNDSNKVVQAISLGIVSNLCRNVELCPFYLGNVPTLSRSLKQLINSSEQDLTIVNIYASSILLSVQAERTTLKNVTIAYQLALQSLKINDAMTQQAAADLLNNINSKGYKFDSGMLNVSNWNSDIFEKPSNPAAFCEALLSEYAISPNEEINVEMFKESEDSKMVQFLSSCIMESLEDDPRVSLMALKFITLVVENSPTKTKFLNSEIFSNILEIGKQKICIDSSGVYHYLKQRSLIFRCLLDSLKSNNLRVEDPSVIFDIYETLDEIQEFIFLGPLTENITSNIRVELCLLIWLMLESQNIMMNQPKILEYLIHGIRSESSRLVKLSLKCIQECSLDEYSLTKVSELICLSSIEQAKKDICTPFCYTLNDKVLVPNQDLTPLQPLDMNVEPSPLGNLLEEQIKDSRLKLDEIARLELDLAKYQDTLNQYRAKERKHMAMLHELSKLLVESERIKKESLQDAEQKKKLLENYVADLESLNKLNSQIKIQLQETNETIKQLSCNLKASQLSLGSEREKNTVFKEMNKVLSSRLEALQERNTKTEEELKVSETTTLENLKTITSLQLEMKGLMDEKDSSNEKLSIELERKSTEIVELKQSLEHHEAVIQQSNSKINELQKELQKVANIREMLSSVDIGKAHSVNTSKFK